MKKRAAVFGLLILGPAVSAPAQAALITAATCEYADVAAAVASASAGDLVSVPAGSAGWDQTLVLTRGIILKGAGADLTRITSQITPANPGNTFDQGNYLLAYRPASPGLNEPLRISGFTFDMNQRSAGLMLANPSSAPLTRVRVDHNTFQNASMAGGSARTLLVNGTIFGVIDNNLFRRNTLPITCYGADEEAWASLSFPFGGPEYIYYEDNVFQSDGSLTHDAGAAGRYCARYNTYTVSASSYPWYDMHGNQPNAHTATMAAELYGNVMNAGAFGVGLFDQRGGKALVFNNIVYTTTSASEKVREEYWDGMNPPAAGPDGQPQHVSDSYFWNNRRNGTVLLNAYIDHDYYDRATLTVNDPPVLAENVTHFNHDPAYDGTAGVGCGPRANRPATANTGTAYWATDQAVDTVDPRTAGVRPAQPVSGTLYKYTASGWTAYFTPYTYPHPLRTLGPLADAVEDQAAAAALVSVFPNPAGGRATFRFRMPATKAVEVKIFNLAGQLVSRVADTLDPQRTDLAWNTEGLAAGVYIYHAASEGKSLGKGKIAVSGR